MNFIFQENLCFEEVLIFYPTLDSTNSEAKRLIDSGKIAFYAAVQAGVQTAGRGRLERAWGSEKPGNIALSIVLREDLLPENMAEKCGFFACFGVLEALSMNEKIKYKWPNDLLVDGRKFCGILAEKYQGFLIIGIGVNVAWHPSGTLFPAAHLEEYGITLGAKEVFEGFLKGLERSPEFIINSLKSRFFRVGEISVNQGKICGMYLDILPSGELLILQNGKQVKISVGDVS